MPQVQCQVCGERVTLDEPIPRDAECASCRNDLRACRNCRHYDPSFNNACRETMADPVEDKKRRNFCEFFYFNRAPFAAAATSREDEARRKLQSMFGGPAPATRPGDARSKLDALFGGSKASAERAAERQDDARRRLDALFRKPEAEEPEGADPADGAGDAPST